MRQIFCFGNELISGDEVGFDIGRLLDSNQFDVVFAMSPNEILNARKGFVILDVAKGVNEVCLIRDVDDLNLIHSITCHDMDLAFHLKLMKATGQIDVVNIVAIPYGSRKENYGLIKEKVEEILSKL